MVRPAAPLVILIAGPGAAGKTSTAERIARHPGWTHLSEDEFWIAVKAGRPAGALRTAGEQRIVWRLVLDRLSALISGGQSVVLEFILYETPPLPLLAYQAGLRSARIPFETRILLADADEVIRRTQQRGRPGDADVEACRRQVLHQLACLTGPNIDPASVLDTTGMSLEQVYERGFRALVETA